MYKLIKINKGNKKYDVSFVKDDEFYNFKISEDLLIEFKLFPPKELSDEKFQEFLNRLPFDSALLEGLKYIEKRTRSRKEIKDHLFEFVSSEKIVEEVLTKLEQKNLINDEYYFKSLVDYLVNYKQDGRMKILDKLREVGLDSYFFEYDKESLKENIKNLSIKYQNKIKKDVSFDERIDKTKKYLYQKGYTESDISNYFNISYLKNEKN